MSAQIQSIERAATVLRLLAGRSGRRGVAELATELRLPKGTVYGILRTLQRVGFVEQDDDSGKYQLGPALLHIGSSYLDGNELRHRALAWADALAAQSRETVWIGALHENLALIVHNVVGLDGSAQAAAVGSLMPLHATALGKALLAHHRDLAGDLMAAGLTPYTTATITEPGRLNAELDHAADRGWASEIGEFLPGVASIAAPVEDRRHAVIGAIAISGAVTRVCPDGTPRSELVLCVMDAALAISRALGASRW